MRTMLIIAASVVIVLVGAIGVLSTPKVQVELADWLVGEEIIDRSIRILAQAIKSLPEEQKKYGLVQLAAAHYYNDIWGALYRKHLSDSDNSVLADSMAIREWKPAWEILRAFWVLADPSTIMATYKAVEPRLLKSFKKHGIVAETLDGMKQFHQHLVDPRPHQRDVGEAKFSHLMIDRRMNEVKSDGQKRKLLIQMTESLIRALEARIK